MRQITFYTKKKETISKFNEAESKVEQSERISECEAVGNRTNMEERSSNMFEKFNEAESKVEQSEKFNEAKSGVEQSEKFNEAESKVEQSDLEERSSKEFDDDDSKKSNKKNKKKEIEELNISLQTYHFEISDNLKEDLHYFARIHQYDDRKAFKEAWQKWKEDEEISKNIEKELKNLISNGYEGTKKDLEEKLFKSVRYYYCKKSKLGKLPSSPPSIPATEESSKKMEHFQRGLTPENEVRRSLEEKPQRKKYEGVSSKILDMMDNHIILQIKTNVMLKLKKLPNSPILGENETFSKSLKKTTSQNVESSTNPEFLQVSSVSPAVAFKDFYELVFEKKVDNTNLFENTTFSNTLQEVCKILANIPIEKIKKTYKNRFFLVRKKIHKE